LSSDDGETDTRNDTKSGRQSAGQEVEVIATKDNDYDSPINNGIFKNHNQQSGDSLLGTKSQRSKAWGGPIDKGRILYL